jgi:hypothetical protein
MLRRITIALLAATVFLPLSSAQMRGGRSFVSSHGSGQHYNSHRFPDAGLLGSPFFYGDYDSNQPYFVEGAPPQIIMMHPPADDSPKKPKLPPLLIEWRGDRYVRFGGADETETRATAAHPDYAESKTTKPQSESSLPKTREAPATILVYRDGHREEISNYAIADGMIYSQVADWQTGYASKPVPLSALDAAATLLANQQRGAKFTLPSASNVVIASF